MTDRLIRVLENLLEHHADDPRLVRMALSATEIGGDDARDLAVEIAGLNADHVPADVSAALRRHRSRKVRMRTWERHSAHLTVAEWEAGIAAEPDSEVLAEICQIAPLVQLSDTALWRLLETRPGVWNKKAARRLTTSFDALPGMETWWVAAMKHLPPERSDIAQVASKPIFTALLDGYAHDLVVDDEDIPPAYRLAAALSPLGRPGELTRTTAAYETHLAAGYEQNTAYVQRTLFDAWAEAAYVPVGRVEELHGMAKFAQLCASSFIGQHSPGPATDWRTLVTALEGAVSADLTDQDVFLDALDASSGWLAKDRGRRLRTSWRYLPDEARTDYVCARVLVTCPDMSDLCEAVLNHLGDRAEDVLDQEDVFDSLFHFARQTSARPWMYAVSPQHYLVHARQYGAHVPAGTTSSDKLREERHAYLLADLRTNPQQWRAHPAANLLARVDATVEDWLAMPAAVARELMTTNPSQTRTSPLLEALAASFPRNVDGPRMVALAHIWESDDVTIADAYGALAGL